MTLLTALQEQSNAVVDNYNANYTINKLANLQELFAPVPALLEYTAEMVPVVKFNLESGNVYCIEMEDFARLKRAQHIDESTALNQIYEAVKYENADEDPEDEIKSVKELAIVLEKEDPEALEKKVKEDPNKVDAKCEAVEAYTEMLNRILEAGAQILYK